MPLVEIVTPPAGGVGEKIAAVLVLVLDPGALALELRLELEDESEVATRVEVVDDGIGVVTGALVDDGKGWPSHHPNCVRQPNTLQYSGPVPQ